MQLHKTLATVSGMTLLSRITGLLREVLFARAFGASSYTDAFNVAFRIPNLLRRLFAEGAFSQAFVPILAQYKEGHKQTKRLIDHVATVLIWATFFTALIGIIGSPFIVFAVATGFKAHTDLFDTAVVMTRVMFPYIIFMSFVALAGGIFNIWNEFKIPAFTPVLLNISFIMAILTVAPWLKQPIYAMAGAVFIGGVLQVLIQLLALRKIGMLPKVAIRPTMVWLALRDEGVQRVLKKMGPAVFAVSTAQISLMINTNIASRLTPGSVSWLSYADRLMEFPTALLGVALGTVLLPSLSKAVNAQNTVNTPHTAALQMQEYSALLDWGLRLTCLLALPCAVGLATLSVPLTATLFHYGKFNALSVEMTSQILICYGIGLMGLIMVKILAPGFYAKQDIATPVKIAIGVLMATQLMNILFVPWLQVCGLALSISVGACLNAGFLLWKLIDRNLYVPCSGWGKYIVQVLIAVFLLAVVAICSSAQVDWIGLQMQPLKRVGALTGVMLLCGVMYCGALRLMGVRFRDFKRTIR